MSYKIETKQYVNNKGQVLTIGPINNSIFLSINNEEESLVVLECFTSIQRLGIFFLNVVRNIDQNDFNMNDQLAINSHNLVINDTTYDFDESAANQLYMMAKHIFRHV